MQAELYRVIAAAADCPVIFSRENGKRPDDPYLLIDILSTRANLPVYRGALDADGNYPIRAIRDAVIQLSAYGEGCYERLDVLAQRFFCEALVILCDALDVAVVSCGDIKNMPELTDDLNYRPRAILECTWRYTATLDDRLHPIETVILSGGTGTADTPPRKPSIDVTVTWEN